MTKEQKNYEISKTPEQYMTKEAFAWLTQKIEQLVERLNQTSNSITELIDPGTFRQGSDVTDTQAMYNQLQKELAIKARHKSNAHLVDIGDQIGPYTIGTKIIIKYPEDAEPIRLEIGTYYDALMGKINEGYKTTYFMAPLFKDFPKWKKGASINLPTGKIALVVDIIEPS